MCGIVGAIDLAGPPPDRSRMEAADALLARRGPDDVGHWRDDHAALAHRRLSVLDTTSAGHQPMLSGDGRHVIVYNGEIYNFRELREQLGADRVWRSESDTEVILAAYARWGMDCVRRLDGMFAFALWDRERHRLFAARDRFGVKPFYYAHNGARLVFASRPEPLFSADQTLARDIDLQALRFHLEAGYIPAPLSIYAGVNKLPAASWLCFDASGLRVGRYWSAAEIACEPAWEGRQEEELLDELDALVGNAVRARMVSDVPLGVFLSGGIDSALVAAVMSRLSSQPVKTFTIGFAESDYDESPHAAAVARQLGTQHHSETLRVDDLVGLLPEFSAAFDEPFFDSSALPAMALSRLARRHVTVALGGEGGDELFGGYHYYRILQGLAPAYRIPSFLRLGAARLTGVLPGHRLKLLHAALREPDVTAAYALMRGIAKDFPPVLLPWAQRQTTGLRELFHASVQRLPAGLTAGEQGMRLDVLHILPEEYLQKLDLASMAFSLEAREPLLDTRLAEWGMRLPLKWKIRGTENKYLLRRLAYRYLPRALLDRPKQGFTVPIDRWLRTSLRNWARSLLEDRALFEAMPLDQGALKALFDLHLSGRRDAHPLLWSALMALEFVRTRLLEPRHAHRH